MTMNKTIHATNFHAIARSELPAITGGTNYSFAGPPGGGGGGNGASIGGFHGATIDHPKARRAPFHW
jgi:hypothetical protein